MRFGVIIVRWNVRFRAGHRTLSPSGLRRKAAPAPRVANPPQEEFAGLSLDLCSLSKSQSVLYFYS